MERSVYYFKLKFSQNIEKNNNNAKFFAGTPPSLGIISTFQDVGIDPETSFRQDRPLSEDLVRPQAVTRRGVRTLSSPYAARSEARKS